MRRITTGFVIVALILAGAQSLKAQTNYATIKIIEFAVATQDSASDEFVEIYNPNSDTILLSGLTLQYRSASGSNWTTKATIDAEIAPRGRLLISTYHEGAITMSSGFAASGGSIRLFDPLTQTQHSSAHWGSAVFDERIGIAAPSKEQSVKRQLNEDGYFEEITFNDSWFVSDTPTPHSDALPTIEQVAQEEAESESETEVVQQDEQDAEQVEFRIDDSETEFVVDTTAYARIEITELLIDPESPLKDADDEYVELYNPGNTDIDLTGYEIQTGATGRYSFIIDGIRIAPKQKLALYSVDTGLVLSNTAGTAQVLSPAGEVLFKVPAYENAKGGVVWARNEAGEWGWSAQQTPGEENTVAFSATATDARSFAREQASSVTASTKRVTTSASTNADSEEDRDVYEAPEEEEPPVNVHLLAGMGGLTVLYAGYEYRTDIANRIYQARRYLRGRSKAG